MIRNYFNLLLKYAVCAGVLVSCKNNLSEGNQTAYFGGEVENPASRFILFCKDGAVLDTISLKKDNTFLRKFDTLPAGLYSFKNEPEYQYVYFDQNDSIMVHIDSNNFDESIVFCGRGGEKNNFLIDMFLKNEKDKNEVFKAFDLNFKGFNDKIDTLYTENFKFYNDKKEELNWTSDFDTYADALIKLPYYSKKEIYPVLHKFRTGNDAFVDLPSNYYSFRKDLDLNNEQLMHFSPYTTYINMMLTNISSLKYHNHLSEVDVALRTSVNKLKSANLLIKNEKVKNSVVNNIAFQYLLEDQNMVHVQEFLSVYKKISTDNSKKNEIRNLGNSIQLLTVGKKLPNITLVDFEGKKIELNNIVNSKTVFFFWTENLKSHFNEAHKKAINFQKMHPDFKFISINVDANNSKWKSIIAESNYPDIQEFHCNNFDDLKTKWAITKVHRTIIVDKNLTILNGFSNIFDLNFEKELSQ